MKAELFWIRLLIILVAGTSLVSSSCQEESSSDYEVVIIGAGAGGLAAGATLSRAGVKTLVLEQHDKPGGYMTAFERGDYRFEVSLHWMDGLDPGGMTRDLFLDLGILDRVQPIRMDPAYRLMVPDSSFDVSADRDTYLKKLQATFPEDAEGIEQLFEQLDAIYDDIRGLTQLEDQFFLIRWFKYLMFRFFYPDFFKNYSVTLDELVGRHVSDTAAKSLIMTLGVTLGIPPSRIPGVIFAVMWGSFHHHGFYHFVGGSQAVSNALAQVIEENGGEVRLNTRVDKILIKEGKAIGIRTDKGREISADYVISNADGYNTYLNLVGEEHLKDEHVKKVKGLEVGISATLVFLGLDLDLQKIGLGEIPEIIYSSGSETDMEKAFQKMMTMNVEETGVAIALYSNTDPSCAPPGKSVVVLLTVATYDWENRWRKGEGEGAYQALKEKVGERMIRQAEKVIPGLRDAIEEIEIATPLTMERYTMNHRGSFIGWAMTPEQSLLKRMPQKSPIDHLYLAGAWTFPGGGQSACLSSGHEAAQLILKEIR